MKNEAANLHQAAMKLAERAFSLEGAPGSQALFRSALEKERRAAELWSETSGLEPTRSVLYRSAASLAWNCQDYSEAERLARTGLAGDPPADIAEELGELLSMLDKSPASLDPNRHKRILRGK